MSTDSKTSENAPENDKLHNGQSSYFQPIIFSDNFVSKYRGLSLEQVMLNGLEKPDQLIEDVLIKGNAHQIFCGPGDGKTWLALYFMALLLKQGKRVAYIDMENGPRITVERLKALGVSDVSNLLYAYAPSLGATEEDRSLFVELLEKGNPELVVFDSLIGCLSACGFDENSNNDVEEWGKTYVNEAKARGCTVLILDHVPHNGDRSRGASRKKDLVDVQWRLKKVGKFDRSTVGYVELFNEKDREAYLPEKVGYSIGGTEDGFILQRSSGRACDYQHGDGLTKSARTALASLGLFGRKGATYTEWRKNTLFNGKEINDSTFRKALDKLTTGEKPYISNDNGKYYVATAPHSTQAALV